MEQEVSLDLKEVFFIIRKRIIMIISITLIASIMSGIISFFALTPVYESQISIVIGKMPSMDSQKQQYEYNDIMMYQNLVKTYARIAQSRTVAENTINKLKLKISPTELLSMLTVIPQTDTQIMDIKIKHTSALMTKNIANAFGEEFINESKRFYPDGSIQIIDKAELPYSPVKPNKKLNIAIAFLLGLIISISIAFLLEFLDSTIKTESDVERYLGLPVLGILPKHNNK